MQGNLKQRESKFDTFDKPVFMGIFRELLQLGNDGLDDEGSSLFVVLNGVLEDDYDRLPGRDSEVDIRRIEQRLEDG